MSRKAGPKSGSVAMQSTSDPIILFNASASPFKTLNSASLKPYSLLSHSRFSVAASTHNGLVSTPTTSALASSASWRIVPTPQNGSSKTLPDLQAERFTIILASRGGIANIFRWLGLPTSRFWNSNGSCTAVVTANHACSLSRQSKTSPLLSTRFFFNTSTCVSCGCSRSLEKPIKSDLTSCSARLRFTELPTNRWIRADRGRSDSAVQYALTPNRYFRDAFSSIPETALLEAISSSIWFFACLSFRRKAFSNNSVGMVLLKAPIFMVPPRSSILGTSPWIFRTKKSLENASTLNTTSLASRNEMSSASDSFQFLPGMNT